MRKFVLILGFLLMPTIAIGADDERAIRNGVDQVIRGINDGDAGLAAAAFAEDAVMLTPDGSRIDGREPIREVLQSIIDAKITYTRIDVTDLGVDGSIAWNVGTFEALVPGEGGSSSAETGTYAVVWKKDSEGVWRIKVDTWNDAAHAE
jgi:uncharacterized protein (TIGR02246 family)